MMISFAVNQDGDSGESTTMTMGGQRKKTDVDGQAELADVPPGTYTVRCARLAPRHARTQQPDRRRARDHRLRRVELEAAGRIRGRVLDADGKQVGMALVTWRKADAAPGAGDREPAVGGNFTLNGLSPGRYKVQALQLAPANRRRVRGRGRGRAGKVAGGVDLRLPAPR